MKTSLFAVLLLTSAVCSAQPARTLENTINSWNFPNLSTEVFDGRGVIVAGSSERDPITGFQVPMFKLTDINLNVPPGGFNPSYYTRFNVNEDRYLMDFTTTENSLSIAMVTMGPNNLVAGATNLYITVIDGPSGNVLQHVNVTPPSTPAATYIPHEIIYSPTANQFAIVGTRITGTLTTANFTAVPKTGFLMIVNAGLPMSTVRFIETNTAGTASNDYDMLESVTEMVGQGYFAGGSSNGITTPTEQNLMVMTASYAGAPMASCVVNSTDNRSVAASVLRLNTTTTANTMVVLSNNSNFRTYELLRFNAACMPSSSSVRHTISGLPTGAVTNGFRLQQDSGGGRVIIAGYIWNAGTGATLTPFQALTDASFVGIGNTKTFQSQNNSPLAGYFNESGAPVFINTPDILSYRTSSNRTYLVNPNTVMNGFDMLRSAPNATLACEVNRTFTPVSTQWPFTMNAVTFIQSIPPLNPQSAVVLNRNWNNTVLCSSTPLAPIDDSEPTLEAAAKVKLFPNPAKDQLSIESDNVLVEAVVYDMKGNKVLAASNNETRGIQQLDISMLKPGMYILSMTDANGTLLREQFVKE